MISVYRADQLKRFASFSYLNHSFILSLNVKVCIRFIVFLQISLCIFIGQELCWMRGLGISFTSSCFLFQVREEGIKKWGQGGLKKLGLEGDTFVVRGRGGGHYMPCFSSMDISSRGNFMSIFLYSEKKLK